MSPRGKGEGSVYRRSDNLWAASIELPPRDGKRRRKVVSAKTKAEVLRKLHEAKKHLETRGDIHTDTLTVAQWFDVWMTDIATKTRRPKTVASYRSVVDRWVVPTIGKTRLDKVSPSTIRRVFTAMETEGKSTTYMRNAHGIMSAAFKDAEREGRISRNPVELVHAPRKAATNLHALTPDEAATLLDLFSETPEGALWATFILTGARRGEVLGLEWDRVGDVIDLSWQLQRITAGAPLPQGFEHRHLTDGFHLTRPKTRAGWRVIPLVDPLKSILDRYRALVPENPHGLVFARPDGSPFDPDYVTKLWPQIREAAGIDKNVRVHDLRHTTVDLLYAAGVDETDIQQIVGHSSRAMSRAYKSQAAVERLRESMLRVSKSLER
jgi:integrase